MDATHVQTIGQEGLCILRTVAAPMLRAGLLVRQRQGDAGARLQCLQHLLRRLHDFVADAVAGQNRYLVIRFHGLLFRG